MEVWGTVYIEEEGDEEDEVMKAAYVRLMVHVITTNLEVTSPVLS